jgi:hypothetical protein
MGLTRGNTEIVRVFTNRTLNANALNSINEGFPIGEGFRRLILKIYINLTHGSGATLITEGELGILKGLSIRTSRGWIPYNNVPGRALWYLDAIQQRTLNLKTAFALVTAIYPVQYNLWFSDPFMMRPDDTILDTSMLSRIQMDLNVGGLLDLMTTPGTDTIVLTADLYAERIRGRLPDKIKPKEYREISCPAPVNPANVTELNLERSENQAYKRILMHAANTATSGTPFSGVSADTTIAAMGIDSDAGEMFNKINWGVLNGITKQDRGLETMPTGWAIFEFCNDKSKMSAILGGFYSRLRVFWDNGTLSTSQVSCLTDCMRRIA